MRVQFLSTFALLASSSEQLVHGKPSGGSSSFGGSRPSSSSSSYSAPRPSPPSYSSPSVSKPNSSPTFNSPYGRPTPRPPVKTPTGNIPYNSKSPYNPNPSYKQLNSSGAPTVRSGGGGFRSTAKSVAVSVAKAAAFGLAVGAVISIVRGAFLYGGRYSSPYCRGDDADRYASGRCPRGYSTTKHQCASQMPMCSIPETVRADWALGTDAPPKVEVSFDGSVCSMVPEVAATVEVVAGNVTSTAAAAVLEGVDGQSGLDECVNRILSSGGCDSYGAGSLFQYDESNGDCGCCSSPQVVPLGNFSAAIYTLKKETTTGGTEEAPLHCVSGATVHYPSLNAGKDTTFKCECGTCTDCGTSGSRYIDWSGPFAVSDAQGDAAIAATTSAPLYDPVDTCICGVFTGAECEEVDSYSQNSGAGAGGSVSLGVMPVVLGFALVLFVGGRR